MITYQDYLKQNGKYATVGIPREVDCAMAHVFHGTSTEVTVLESSMVRDSSLDSAPLLRYASRNISAVMRMEIYWSPVATFIIAPVMAVAPTRPASPRTHARATSAIVRSIPPAYITPPNDTAQRISQTVVSIPDMPRVDTSRSMTSLPVATCVGAKNVVISAL